MIKIPSMLFLLRSMSMAICFN